MRSSSKTVIAAVAVRLMVAAGGGFTANQARALPVADCGSTTASDSAYLIEFVRRVATDPGYGAARTFSQIPQSDSAKFWATPADCDRASSRYRAHLVAETGDSSWESSPVLLVRIFPSRFVADPQMTDGHGSHVLVTLDTNLNILKVWKTH